MSDFLPEELVVEILRRLHIKTLLRCTAVCKSWNFLIKSPTFVTTHSKKRSSSCNDHNLLLFGHDHGRRYTVHLDDDQLQEYLRMDFPFRAFNGGTLHAVRGYCEGLLYVSDLRFPHKSMILWNPLIRKFIVITEPFSTSLPLRVVCGLGYDSATNDYKILKIEEFKNGNQHYREAQVFSLKSSSWKIITPPDTERVCSQMVYVNGFLHFVACRRVKDAKDICTFILGFDVGAEVFCEIMLPEPLRSIKSTNPNVFVYRGSSIAVAQFDVATQCSRQLWFMREYGVVASWTQLLAVREDLHDAKVLAFRKNGEIILEKFDVPRLVSFDPESKQMKDITNLGPYGGVGSVTGYHFQESLALLDAEYSTNDEDVCFDFEDYFL